MKPSVKRARGSHNNPQIPGAGVPPDFHPMKGPMMPQTLRGLVDHGPMHWRGDRSGADDPGTSPFDPFAAFMKFNGAFVSLLGRDEILTNEEMATFTNFILQVTNPPPQIRNLDNSLTSEQQTGANFFGATRSIEHPSTRLPGDRALDDQIAFRCRTEACEEQVDAIPDRRGAAGGQCDLLTDRGTPRTENRRFFAFPS